jgi:hypothetical protein
VLDAIGCWLARAYLDHSGHGAGEPLQQLPAERANSGVDGDDPAGDAHGRRLQGVDLFLQATFQVGADVVVAAGDQAQQVAAGDHADHPVTGHHRDRLEVVSQHHAGRDGGVGVLSQRVHRVTHHLAGGVGPAMSGGRARAVPGAGRGLEREQVGLGHDPDQPVAVVDHRHGIDSMLDQGGGHGLEWGVRWHGDHRAAHDVACAHGVLRHATWASYETGGWMAGAGRSRWMVRLTSSRGARSVASMVSPQNSQ